MAYLLFNVKEDIMAHQAIYGIVKNRADLERIVQDLKASGVTPADISFLSQQGSYFPELGSSQGSNGRNWRTEERLTDYPAGRTTVTDHPIGTDASSHADRAHGSHDTQGGLGAEKNSKAPEGATTGATTGGILGGVLGLLAGIGALAIPGLGPFIAAGPLLATLSGIGAGGTLGGIIGALVGAGIPEYEAKRYENHLKEGGILLSVRAHSDMEATRIKDILQRDGAQDVSASSEASTSTNYDA
jgi:hypothetical protein